MWAFFSRAVTAAVTCIAENETIVRKARQVSAGGTALASVVLYQLFPPHRPGLGPGRATDRLVERQGSWNLLWIVVVTRPDAFALYTLAVSLWFSTLGVFFRDMRDICEVMLPMLFWATPVFYTRQMAPPSCRPECWR